MIQVFLKTITSYALMTPKEDDPWRAMVEPQVSVLRYEYLRSDTSGRQGLEATYLTYERLRYFVFTF